ncbi:MAG: hypothetical protein JXD22_16360 [Sedimentisphaerales bacterium]|nr:hypothetical protein [Sedimentisphaerales bacterium]
MKNSAFIFGGGINRGGGVALGLLAILLVGCGDALRSDDSMRSELSELRSQSEQLQQQNNQQREQIGQLQQQMSQLRGFGADRLEHLVRADKIEFGRFSRAYDDDKDGVDDGLVIYLLVRDQQGDVIKAAGEVEIEVWDLAAGQGQQQLGQWQFEFEKLGEYWLSGALADHYKFTLAWQAGKKPTHANLTVKLVFKDALEGKVFEANKLIEAKVGTVK